MTKLKVIAASIACAALLAGAAHASGTKQFSHRVSVGGKSGAVLIVGWSKDEANIQKLVNLVAQHANEAYRTITGDLGRIAGTQGSVDVGWQTAELLAKGIQVSKWTKVDVLSASGSSGGYKDISVNEKKRTVDVKKPGLRFKADSIMSGYLADLMIRYIHSSGMQNALVKVGNVFRGLGSSMHGPWKIQVQEDSSTYARHALNLPVSNVAIATISSTQLPGKSIYSPRAKHNIATQCKGTTIVMGEAAQAEGVAYAIMIAGPGDGMKIMGKAGATGLIVDLSGKFLRRGI
jgi:thiamine biosynthesis lipoprotein ApbE